MKPMIAAMLLLASASRAAKPWTQPPLLQASAPLRATLRPSQVVLVSLITASALGATSLLIAGIGVNAATRDGNRPAAAGWQLAVDVSLLITLVLTAATTATTVLIPALGPTQSPADDAG